MYKRQLTARPEPEACGFRRLSLESAFPGNAVVYGCSGHTACLLYTSVNGYFPFLRFVPAARRSGIQTCPEKHSHRGTDPHCGKGAASLPVHVLKQRRLESVAGGQSRIQKSGGRSDKEQGL